MSCAFNDAGGAVMAYENAGLPAEISVMDISGGSATFKGMAYFTDGSAGEDPSLAVSPDGTPFVAFVEVGHGSKVTVMRYVGGD
jgi:hypothetical protein